MMRLNTLRYLFKEGMIGLWRNRTMAVASVGTIVLCLFILGISYGIGANVDSLIQQAETQFGITAYIKDGLAEEDITNLQKQIENIANVSEVIYISKEEALQCFSQDNEDESLFEMFKEDNPLPASFEITTTDVSKQEEVINILNNTEGIDETVYFQTESQSFASIKNAVNYICLGTLVILVLVGLMLMSNTIKLTVYVRRREINIMKYVGATNSFIQFPFLIEGMIIGFIGALISIICIMTSYKWILEKFVTSSGVFSDFTLVSTGAIAQVLIPMYLILGIGIGLIGSAIAIHKHLDV